ncbi:hypothetical protein SLEP1_g26518 [Rubroshorea leprosula]|uniref:(+)-delta-cadinene synthase n=1 Tax=Rubroshorea leprosula TaxID=152421 RepID=A0AAV5JTL1_9ROSI|nr:hypothetical protein SLEP1_g26518 [Rubroshorea leprosula]
MSAQPLALPSAPQNTTCKNVHRSTSSYHPSLWKDYFLRHSSNSTNIEPRTQEEHEKLKQQVRRMLTDATTIDPSKKLHLIDAAQRLGIAYHFEIEIDHALEKIHLGGVDHVKTDLQTIAVWFRLLRQQGIKVPSEIFKKFMDVKGKFKEDLVNDVLGMLNLYEAAHLRLRGEDILDEALAFTTSCLESMATKVSPLLAEQIAHALNRPIRKGLPRIEARHYISLYSRDNNFVSSNAALLKFAKIDYNMVQAFHLEELKGIVEWWEKLDVATKLPYARDRIVECFFWIMGAYFEPKYSLARTFLTKIIAMTSILDDTYDNYGTYEELEVLTKCIERWDISVIDQLPEYMKLVYQSLLDVYGEMEAEVTKEGRSYAVDYGKESMKKIVKAYFEEAKWCKEGYVPPMDEYMQVALISSAYPMLITNSFVGMGEVATKDAFDWISNNPKMLKASTIICRFMDDITSHELEQSRDHVASIIECYMKQYGLSMEDIMKLFREEIANAWKDINEGFMKPTAVPMPILTRVLNFSRVIDVIYKDIDGYTNSHILKDYIVLLLVDPVIL